MVRGRELPEGAGAAVAHVDVLVHPARPEQRRVEPVHVVGGEDEDALVAAARPEPVHHVEQPGQGDLHRAVHGVVGAQLGKRQSWRLNNLFVSAVRCSSTLPYCSGLVGSDYEV